MPPETKPETIALDVRPILAAGEEPFTDIMRTAARVPPGGVLELTAPFEPRPLYRVMSEKGFAHVTDPRGPAEWVVRFTNLGITAEAVVGSVSEQFPGTGPVFAKYGVDPQASGVSTLGAVAQAHGVALPSLLAELQDAALHG